MPNTKTGVIRFVQGEQIELFCNSGFYLKHFQKKSILAECLTESIFTVDGVDYNLKQLRCVKNAYHTARRTQIECFDDSFLSEIGFKIDESRFLKTMDICHDEKLGHTHYVHYLMSPANIAYQKSNPRPSFIQGSYYPGREVNVLYTINEQRKTVASILNSEKLAADYIKNGSDQFLARGHLAGKADFIFASHQNATFYFLNVAPQWQKFNSGNWERIETNTRNFISKKNDYYDIFTGTYGVMTLADENGYHHEIYLSSNSSEGNTSTIPVPKIYYRVIYHQQSKAAVVLVGVNNPFATDDEIKDEYIFCNDIKEKIKWVNWNKVNSKKGYLYACDFNDFAKYIEHLPDLHVTQLLI